MNENAHTSQAIFNDEEVQRYARHLVMPEIGGQGQQRLKAARVAVVGAGGLGSPCLLYLAAAGVGHITVIDDDQVSLSNLQRQVLHRTQDVGRPKTDRAHESLIHLNPHVAIATHATRVDGDNAASLFEGAHLVVDATATLKARKVIAKACEDLRLPMVTAAVNRFDGTMTTLMPWEELPGGMASPTIHDLYPEHLPDNMLPTCAEVGVLGVITGVMGALQALEVIKLITGVGETMHGRSLLFDGLTMRFEMVSWG